MAAKNRKKQRTIENKHKVKEIKTDNAPCKKISKMTHKKKAQGKKNSLPVKTNANKNRNNENLHTSASHDKEAHQPKRGERSHSQSTASNGDIFEHIKQLKRLENQQKKGKVPEKMESVLVKIVPVLDGPSLTAISPFLIAKTIDNVATGKVKSAKKLRDGSILVEATKTMWN